MLTTLPKPAEPTQALSSVVEVDANEPQTLLFVSVVVCVLNPDARVFKRKLEPDPHLPPQTLFPSVGPQKTAPITALPAGL